MARGRPAGRWRGVALIIVVGMVFLALVTARNGDKALYPPKGDDAVTIYLVDNGFHTDLALPHVLLKGHLIASAAARVTDLPWVAIGWGDEHFFIERGFSGARVVDALRALFVPGNSSAVRIDGLPRRPDQLYGAHGVHAVRVSRAGLARLLGRIDRSLVVDSRGQVMPMAAPPMPDSGFFESVETFSLAHLCNHWTADLLDAAGVPTTPVLDTFPFGLIADLELHAALAKAKAALDNLWARR